VRRLPARIDGDAPDTAVARWLTDRRPHTAGPRALSVDGKSLRVSEYGVFWPWQDFREAGLCHRAPMTLRHG
jgi:hypothetical protein